MRQRKLFVKIPSNNRTSDSFFIFSYRFMYELHDIRLRAQWSRDNVWNMRIYLRCFLYK